MGLVIEEPNARFSTPEKLRDLLKEAGFKEVRVWEEDGVIPSRDATPLEYATNTWNRFVGSAFYPLEGLEVNKEKFDEMRSEFIEGAVEQASKRVVGEQIVNPFIVLFVVAKTF